MNQERDYILQKILKQVTLEEPSMDFTQKIMGKLQSEVSVENVGFLNSLISKYLYFILSITLVIAIIVTYSVYPQFFAFINSVKIFNVLKPLSSVFINILTFIKTQPIVAIVVFSLAGLFAFDKLLSLLFRSKIQHT